MSERDYRSRDLLDAVVEASVLDTQCYRERDLEFFETRLSQEHFEALKAFYEVKDLTALFEEHVWYDHLRDMHNEATKALKGEDDKRKLMILETGGRVLITLQDAHPQNSKESSYGGATITFVTDPDATRPVMGYQSLAGTLDEIRRLVRDVVEIGPKIIEENSGLSVGF